MASIFERYQGVIIAMYADELDDLIFFRDNMARAGFDCLIVCLSAIREIKANVLSIFDYFLISNTDTQRLLPLAVDIDTSYFIDVCRSNSGWIRDKTEPDKLVGYIKSDTNQKVDAIMYHGAKGQYVIEDDYNHYGSLCSRMNKDNDGKVLGITHFNDDGQETIYEDYENASVRLFYDNKDYCFSNRGNFALWFFKHFGLLDKKLFFQRDCYVVQTICEQSRDVIRICEDIDDKVCDEKYHCSRFVFKKPVSDSSAVVLGKIYDFEKSNGYFKNVVMNVDKDRIAAAKKLIEGLPFLKFHITTDDDHSAVDVFRELFNYNNVEIYNCDLYMSLHGLLHKKLFSLCDMAIDLNGVLYPFEKDMFFKDILMFSITGQADKYVHPSHICRSTSQLISKLLLYNTVPDSYKNALDKQHECICRSDLSDYVNFVETVLNNKSSQK